MNRGQSTGMGPRVRALPQPGPWQAARRPAATWLACAGWTQRP